jgi:hypothetical protein
MKFPVKVTYRKAEAKIYGKNAGYQFYRLCYYAAGKRHVRSFSTYSEAKTAADTKVKELANGNQSIALTAKEATVALSIRDALDAYRRAATRAYTALEALTASEYFVDFTWKSLLGPLQTGELCAPREQSWRTIRRWNKEKTPSK